MKSKRIRLFWWSEPYLMGKSKENYGDLVGKYLAKKISGLEVVWSHPKKWHFRDLFSPIYVTAGSILANVNSKCIVWGSGIIEKNQIVKTAKFLAVRGPQTRKNLVTQGHDVPKVYGDPALLLSRYYNPNIEKSYKLGIVPHYMDYEFVKQMYFNDSSVCVIDLMTTSIEATTDIFLKCERILSSSLHGIIVSHAYQIPAIWVEFSDKLFGDGIKFKDYFESVNLNPYPPQRVSKKSDIDLILSKYQDYPNLPDYNHISTLQDNLLDSCPFKADT